MKRFIIFTLTLMMLCSCAGKLTKICNELNKASKIASDAVVFAQAENAKDPNYITIEDIDKLMIVRDTLVGLTATSCSLDALTRIMK